MHVHDEIGDGQDHLINWDLHRMRRHLLNVHRVTVSLDWDLGRLHQLHLEHHQVEAVAELPKAEPVSTAENPQVTLDRVICAMAGLDFDRDWVADSGMGSHNRGIFRQTYAEAARRLLTWLERGGLAAIPGYLDLLDQQAMADRDEAIRLRDEAVARRDEAIVQQRVSQQAMQEMAGELEVAQSIQHELEEKDESWVRRVRSLESRLAEAVEQRDEAVEVRDRAQQALMAKLTEVGELREDRDNLEQRLVEMATERAQALDDRDTARREQALANERSAGLTFQLEESERRRHGLFQEMGEIRRQLEEASGEWDLLRQDKHRLKADLETMAAERAQAYQALSEAGAELARYKIMHENQVTEIKQLRALADGPSRSRLAAVVIKVCECEENGGRLRIPHVHLPEADRG